MSIPGQYTVYGNSQEECYHNLQVLLTVVKKAVLKVNAEKRNFNKKKEKPVVQRSVIIGNIITLTLLQ